LFFYTPQGSTELSDRRYSDNSVNVLPGINIYNLNIMVKFMSSYKVAIPSDNPGGMEADRSDHFGHSDLFTLLEIEDHKVVSVSTHENIAHAAGGCMAPVKVLAEAGVKKMIVGGMGGNPLSMCAEIGMTVFFAARDKYALVSDVAAAFIGGELPEMNTDQVCKGGGNCHH
jgi:predicted Fe-Mo cluster-binding NifX family protein